MNSPVRTGLVFRLVAGGSAGLLAVLGMFALLEHLVDAPVNVARPAVESPIYIVQGPVCDCGIPEPWRFRMDFPQPHGLPLLHEMLTPLTSMIAPVTITDEPVDVQILFDFRSFDFRLVG